MSTASLERRPDGSVALFIGGDLQFDSRDEAIYHECLALPALALAESRIPGPIRALICGGGDGLIARELLKSPRILSVDLVDHDPTVLALARTELVPWNRGSLLDPRVSVQARDAWEATADDLAAGRRYGLIVADFTVPQDGAGAALHSIDWYQRLAALLLPDGILAVNGVCPTATPEAFWSIHNGMRVAGLHPRPYRIALPSFIAQDYGPDWGFLIASPAPIPAAAITDDLPLALPRLALRDPAQLRRLAMFAASVASCRTEALPARAGSDRLLQYLALRRDPTPEAPEWDGFADRPEEPIPRAEDTFLPPAVVSVLAAPASDLDGDALLAQVLDLMPSFQPHQTREMVETVIRDPGRFLRTIDLGGLVDRLLKRAAELPCRIVAELRHLQGCLRHVGFDGRSLLKLGLRVITVVVVVVILANLVFPDTAYGKVGAVHHVALAATGFAHSSHAGHESPSFASNGGFRSYGFRSHTTFDEFGNYYPSRTYLYHRSWSHRPTRPGSGAPASEAQAAPQKLESVFRLTPDTDVLDGGRIAVSVSEKAYLLIDETAVQVVDRNSGHAVFALARQDNLIYRLAKELERQGDGLKQSVEAKKAWNAWVGWLSFTPWFSGDQREAVNLAAGQTLLQQARLALGIVPSAPPGLPQPPVTGAHELFASVWLMPDGSGILVALPDQAFGVLTPSGWQGLPGRPAPALPGDPAGFRVVMADVLQTMVRNNNATLLGLQREKWELEQAMVTLQQDIANYEIDIAGGESEVEYGSDSLKPEEALRRTRQDLDYSQAELERLTREADQWPVDVAHAEALLRRFRRSGG